MTFAARSIPSSLRIGLAAVALAVAACASTSMPAKVADGTLTNPGGMTLYTFDRDTASSGKSVCNGPCIQLWPAFAAPADASASTSGDWTVITRDDGGKQWAFKGKPLYTYSKDTRAGDRTGDGFNNVWHTARP